MRRPRSARRAAPRAPAPPLQHRRALGGGQRAPGRPRRRARARRSPRARRLSVMQRGGDRRVAGRRGPSMRARMPRLHSRFAGQRRVGVGGVAESRARRRRARRPRATRTPRSRRTRSPPKMHLRADGSSGAVSPLGRRPSGRCRARPASARTSSRVRRCGRAREPRRPCGGPGRTAVAVRSCLRFGPVRSAGIVRARRSTRGSGRARARTSRGPRRARTRPRGSSRSTRSPRAGARGS